MLVRLSEFEKTLSLITKCEEIAIDVETYWTEGWDQRKIIGVSIYGEAEGKYLSCYYPFRHDWDDVPNLPIECLSSLAKTLDEIPLQLYHNAKFDRQMFWKDGIELTAPFQCSMIISHMVNENDSHELEDLAEKFGIDPHANARKAHIHEMRKHAIWHKIDSKIMSEYAKGDTRNTYYLVKKLRPILERQELAKLWPTEETYSDALMMMEITGIEIDPSLAAEFSSKSAQRMNGIKKELGFDPAKPLPLATKLFKELKLPLPELGKPSKQFPGGRPTMNEATLERLGKTATGEAQKVMDLVLEYRGLQKARSTWYEGWLERIDSSNKLHPVFHQHGTVTTRLSSAKPNMQQIPRADDSVGAAPNPKKLLRAPKGFELWEFDWSQIEYRLAGVLSGDPVILDAYRNNSDMHTATGLRLGQSRQDAKTTNFRFLYEGGPTAYAEAKDISFAEAKKVYSNYHQLYHHMFRYANRVNMTAAQRGYIRLWDGRRRHFKHQFETKKAWNSLVQGGAALITKHGIIRCHQDKELLSRMNSAVHDSIWFEIPEFAVHTEMAKIKQHLEWASYDSRFLIPFPVEWSRLA